MNTIQNSFKQLDPDLGMISSQGISQEMRAPVESKPGSNGPGFLQVLEKSMEDVNTNQVAADQSIKDLVAGRNKNIHETMLAIQKADLSLKTMMQVRNKVLEAYKEIMRMQV